MGLSSYTLRDSITCSVISCYNFNFYSDTVLSLCTSGDHVHFEDLDFILGSLAYFPPVLLQKLLTDKHLVGLSVFSHTQLTELLPRERKRSERGGERETERGERERREMIGI